MSRSNTSIPRSHTLGHLIHKVVSVAVTSVLALTSVGCAHLGAVREAEVFDGIFASSAAKVYADSIVTADGAVWHPSQLTGETAGHMRLSSPSAIADSLTARTYVGASSPPLSIWLAEAITNPARSMERLRELAPDGIVERAEFPISYTHAEWGAAAWEVYCTTGSEEWLREAYGILMATMRAEAYRVSHNDGLLQASEPFLGEAYPSWMTAADRAESVSLYNNVWHWRTIEVAAMMAERLGLPTAQDLRRKGAQLREALNTHFWIPYLNSYGALLYGFPTPVLSPVSESRAQYLCALLGISTPEMSAALVDGATILPRGIPDIYPITESTLPTCGPTTQALAALAAARIHSSGTFSAALGALWLDAMGGEVGAEWSALLLRGILGMIPSPDGLRIDPYIPSATFSPLTLSGVPWREATLTFRIQGTGDRIASLSVDSKPVRGTMIPADLTRGHHTVDIVMAGNYLQPSTAKVSEPDKLPTLPPPPEASLGRDGHLVVSRLPEGVKDFQWYVDGVAQQCVPADGLTKLTLPEGSAGALASISTDGTAGWTGPQLFKPVASVEATSITPRRPPINRIHDRETASRYIELAPRHNTRLTFYVKVPAAGRYLARMVYSNGLDLTAMRTLAVIDAEERHVTAGILVCPTSRPGDWVNTTLSTPVEVTLDEGVNRLSLTYITGTILFNRLELYPMPRQ